MGAEDLIFLSGLYSATPAGEVFSTHGGAPRKMKLTPIKGYLKFNAHVSGRQLSISVHRFVWRAVRGPIPAGLQVNHKNFDKSDNRVSNLELLTHQENLAHSVEFGGRHGYRHTDPIGVLNGRARLTEAQAREIEEQHRLGLKTLKDLSRQYNMSYTAIRLLCTRKTWRHLWE